MPTIGLLTDFGLQDPYVGAMKGAILSVCPEATLVDLGHEIPAHDITAGALALETVYGYFPAGTVFAAVVDPGVGSARRPIAIRAGSWVFVGPDNGLFTFVLDAHPTGEIRQVDNPLLRRHPLSPVFHGRDLFGPAAAHLARGFPFEDVGSVVTDPVRIAATQKKRTAEGWEGAVLRVDRFGNLTTSLREQDLAVLESRSGTQVEVLAAGQALRFVSRYSEVGRGEPCALIGSSGRLEIAVNQGRADRLLELQPGDPILLRATR